MSLPNLRKFYLVQEEILQIIFGQKWRVEKQMFVLKICPYIGKKITKIRKNVAGQKWRGKRRNFKS